MLPILTMGASMLSGAGGGGGTSLQTTATSTATATSGGGGVTVTGGAMQVGGNKDVLIYVLAGAAVLMALLLRRR